MTIAPLKQPWLPIRTAPRDGSDVIIQLPFSAARAYWDNNLETWVLVRPLHVESIREPLMWRKA